MLLVCLGLAMLFSSGTTDDSFMSTRFIRQIISFIIAIAGYIALSLIPYHKIRRYAPVIYTLGLIGLFIASQIGRVIRGTTSRLEIIGAQFQPSEFMKVAIVIALAWLFSKWSINQTRTLFLSAAIVGAATILIILEPDFGMAALVLGTWLGLIIYLGLSWRVIGLIGVAGVISFFGAWQWLFADYQKARILTFLDPTSDPLGAGYNVMQSIVAIGSGGLIGRGLGHGPQSQLQFLPEQHTDFIFASLGEELGFAGLCLLVALYVVMLWRVQNIAKATEDPFGRYLAAGTFLVLLFGFFVSAGMNMGLLPVTGIPLPLVSYGGSNLLSTMLLLGIVQSVHLHSKWVRKPPSELTHFS